MRFLPHPRGLPAAFWLLWAGTLINRIGGFVVPFLALYLTNERGMPVEEAGRILALVGFGWIASGPVGGALADRVGRRFTLGAGTALGALAMLALGFARTTAGLAAGALALGFFGELYRPAVAAMVTDLVPSKDRPRAFGLLYWAVNLGFSLAPVIAGVLAGRGFTLLFVADAATTAAFGALVVLTVKETRVATPAAAGHPKARLSAPYRDGAFLAFAGLSALVALVFFQGFVTLPVDLRAHGIAPRTFGILLAVNGVLVVTLQPVLTPLVTRMPRGLVLALGAALTGAGFGMTGIAAGSVAVYAASIAVWTLGEIVMAPITPSVIADLAPPELRGSYQGAFQITYGAASFLAPVLGSMVLARFGSVVLWGACAVVGLVAASGFARIAPRADRRRLDA